MQKNLVKYPLIVVLLSVLLGTFGTLNAFSAQLHLSEDAATLVRWALILVMLCVIVAEPIILFLVLREIRRR